MRPPLRRPAARPSIAGALQRGCTPSQLRSALQGDLDAILLRALAQPPEQRYGTVDQLADDLERHLASRPVVARRPTLAYRARRFVRRHRRSLGAVTVVAGLAGALLWTRGNHVQRLASVRDRVEQAVVLLTDRLAAPVPPAGDVGMPSTSMLDLALSRADLEAHDRPHMQAMVLYALGSAQRDAGLHHGAMPLLEHALALRRSVFVNADHWDVAASLHAVGSAASALGGTERAERLLGRALAMRRRLVSNEHPAVAETLEASALNQWRNVDLQAATATLASATALRARVCRRPSLTLAGRLESRGRAGAGPGGGPHCQASAGSNKPRTFAPSY